MRFETPRKLHERPRRDTVATQPLRSAVEVAGLVSGAGAGIQPVAVYSYYRRTDDDYQGLAEPKPFRDHTRKYGEHIANQLSGKGHRHDPLGVSAEVMKILKGAGLHGAPLLNTYVHGRVRRQVIPWKPRELTSSPQDDQLYTGGNLPTVHSRHSEEGALYHSGHYPAGILVV